MFNELSTPAVVAPAARILVVDDEPHLRTIISRWLTEAGYSCAQAGDADAAWEYLERLGAELVTLDISMPGRSGADLLEQIKLRSPDTEVIMLTALGHTHLAVETLTRGAYGYLIKPVEPEDLLYQVQKALERRQLLLEKRRYLGNLEDTVRVQTATIRQAHEETVLRLVSASRYRDEETGAHIKRTGLYSELFAEVLGWPADKVENIRVAAPMHDVGKIGIPDAILQKPGTLTRDEFEIMKTHATIGAKMLAESESSMLQMAHEIALCHHEHWDGRGYPRGITETAIPEAARIVAIVDVYDALTHNRVYRPAMPETEALALMERGRGGHFDPFLFGIFLSLVPELRRIADENRDERADDYARRMLPAAKSPIAAAVPGNLPQEHDPIALSAEGK
jgi:putative two-component system response regulator